MRPVQLSRALAFGPEFQRCLVGRNERIECATGFRFRRCAGQLAVGGPEFGRMRIVRQTQLNRVKDAARFNGFSTKIHTRSDGKERFSALFSQQARSRSEALC